MINNKSKTIIQQSEKQTRRSPRGRLSIGVISIGKNISGFKGSSSFASEDELNNLVDILEKGPTVVSIPIPPKERHAFLVDIQTDKIMISDWGGESNKTRGILTSKNYNEGWEQYSELMIKLVEKYKRPIKYFRVDSKLKKETIAYHESVKGGGCSYYIYKWLPIYYPDYIS